MKSRSAFRLLATQQSPTVPPSPSNYDDHTGSELLAEPVIAPGEDYKDDNEHQLEHQQSHRQTEENKEATSPTSDMSRTAVHNNENLKTISAVTPSGLDGADLPQTSQQYAGLPARSPKRSSWPTPTKDDGNATRRPESTKNPSLYDTTASLRRLITSARGGIMDTHGDPNIDLDEDQSRAKPNSQVLPCNGSTVEADRLGTESDPLTKDQENYGTSGRPAFADSIPMLLDPATVSTYSRDNNLNRNTTEKDIEPAESHNTGSTVDEPEPAGTLDMKGQEGIQTFSALKRLAAAMRATPEPHDMSKPADELPKLGYSKPGLKHHKRHLGAKSLYDGDFDPAGRTTGDHMITENPDNHGYYNLHSSAPSTSLLPPVEEDAALEMVCEEQEVDADADPRLFNLATQPLGMAG